MKNPQSAIRILLVEDNPGDARLVKEMLTESIDVQFHLEWVDNLSKCLELLTADPDSATRHNNGGQVRNSQSRFDIALLDLSLPESQGIETLERVFNCQAEIPIVIMTGLGDEIVAARSLQAGAQDYLVRGQTDSALLVRSIRYAMERYGLLRKLEQVRYREQQLIELKSLETLSAPPKTSVTAQMYGQRPLRKGVPDLFKELVDGCGDIMDQAIEQRAYKVDNQVSAKLRPMSEQLGFLKAGPRDVVEIYNATLKDKIKTAIPQKGQAYVEEGRMIILELMGLLVSYYRNYAK